MLILSAASSNHFAPLCNLLDSIDYHYPTFHDVTVYDIGLSETERDTIEAREFVTIESFPFAEYPPHLNPHTPAGARSCAWKPVLIRRFVHELALGVPVLWLDAGCLVHGQLNAIDDILIEQGIYTPRVGATHTIDKWGHPVTLARLEYSSHLWSSELHYAGVVGFGPRGRPLLERWADHCLDADTIRPRGWNIEQHRSDMVVLSILLYQMQTQLGYTIEDRKLNVSVLNDKLTPEQARATFTKPVM